MRRKNIIFAGICILAVSILWTQWDTKKINHQPAPQKRLIQSDTDDNQPPSHPVIGVKESWGMYPREPHKIPEVTAKQWSSIKKNNAIFVGDTSKKQIALTFDMGYEEPGSTDSILKTLQANKLKATFFSTAYWLKKNPELARRIVKEGHTLGNHSVNHLSMPTLSEKEMNEEIMGWQKAATEATGIKKFTYFRPPMGEYNDDSLAYTRKLGYTTVFWSVAIVDWKDGYLTREQIIKQVSERIHPGAVVLLHHKNKDVQAGLDQIIKTAQKDGYKIVPLDNIGRPK